MKEVLKGRVTSVGLRDGRTYTTIEVRDPRFTTAVDYLHIETSELSLGEEVIIDVSNGDN